MRTFLSEYHLPASVRPVLGWDYIWAFFRSILRIGLLDKSRVEYWKLLAWTLFRKPKLFAMAITLAIYGFHFQRICDKYLGDLAHA